jgi:hypothetical protein
MFKSRWVYNVLQTQQQWEVKEEQNCRNTFTTQYHATKQKHGKRTETIKPKKKFRKGRGNTAALLKPYATLLGAPFCCVRFPDFYVNSD